MCLLSRPLSLVSGRAALLFAPFTAPTAVTKIAVNVNQFADRVDFGNMAIQSVPIVDGQDIPTPSGPHTSLAALTQFTVAAAAGGNPSFKLQRQGTTWQGGLPSNMYVVFNQGFPGGVRLNFTTPLAQFYVYIEVRDYIDYCLHYSGSAELTEALYAALQRQCCVHGSHQGLRQLEPSHWRSH